jgi:hypothetical protein
VAEGIERGVRARGQVADLVGGLRGAGIDHRVDDRGLEVLLDGGAGDCAGEHRTGRAEVLAPAMKELEVGVLALQAAW